MKYASGNDKKMKNGVHPFFLFTKSVENRTNGVCYTAGHKKYHTAKSHYFICLSDKEDDDPSHRKIAEHGKNTIFF